MVPMRWPDYSQGRLNISFCLTEYEFDYAFEILAWGAASLGSIDLSVIALAISPTGVSANGG